MKRKFLLFFVLICLYLIFYHTTFAQSVNDPLKPLPSRDPGPVESTTPRDNSLPVAPNRACPKGDITLNTDFPFIGRCIKKSLSSGTETTTIANVFPKLTGQLVRLLMTAIVILGFLGILVGGFMIAGNGALGTKQQGRKIIVTIVLGLILLGATGIILNLLNPEFFGTNS